VAGAGARRRGFGSRGFWLAIAGVVVAFVLVRLSTSEHGQVFLTRTGVTDHFVPALAGRLDVALADRLVPMGLVRGDIKVGEATEGGRRIRQYTFPCPQHLTPTLVHLELWRAARSVFADVLQADIRHERGDQLVLLFGYGRMATHRLVVRTPAPPRATAEAPRKPRLALLIDDFGHNMNSTARGILDLGVPLTITVLPNLSKSKAAFEAARERGIPALLHLPMEPEGDEDPGRHPVTVGMSMEEIDELLDRYERRYESFFGVNNHMGSRATADRPTMEALMKVLRKRDLIFVDSQTTARSVGRKTARDAGVWYVANDLFLDDGQETTEQVAANLERLAAMARKRGLAVGIGHPHPETLAALRTVLPRLQAHGIELVTVESLAPAPANAVPETAGR